MIVVVKMIPRLNVKWNNETIVKLKCFCEFIEQ